LHLSLQSTHYQQSRGRKERVFCSAIVTERMMDARQSSVAKAPGCQGVICVDVKKVSARGAVWNLVCNLESL